jgi:maltose O-acetyltransferase
VATLAESLRGDLRIARRHLLVNALAGAFWMPRAARVLLYRLAGIRALRANVYSGCRFTGTDVAIGAGTFVNHECYFDVGRTSLRIGRDCNLGPQVGIFSMTHRVRPEGGYDRRAEHRPVTVGDRVWIGARATILPGVTIGDDVVVAAGAVVASDCREPGVYRGVPARRADG